MIEENISLKEYTNYQIGGAARFFLETNKLEELISDLNEWKKISAQQNIDPKNVFILGKGTNILVPDEGFNGLVIYFNNQTIELLNDHKIKVGNNLTIQQFNDFLTDNSLSGFEWSGGLPGTIGGAVFGNAGAFGGETKDNCFEVESLDLDNLGIVSRNSSECKFGYRTSIFKQNAQKEIIINITFQFAEGNKEQIRTSVADKISYRQERQPLDLPSAGSTFKNVSVEKVPAEIKEKFANKIKNDPSPVIPAAVFLSEAGLKGFQIGGAQVSTKHPNFIVNINHATSQDVKEIINHIIKLIHDEYKVELEPEIIFVEPHK